MDHMTVRYIIHKWALDFHGTIYAPHTVEGQKSMIKHILYSVIYLNENIKTVVVDTWPLCLVSVMSNPSFSSLCVRSLLVSSGWGCEKDKIIQNKIYNVTLRKTNKIYRVNTWWNSTRRLLVARYLSTDKAAIHPDPAAVTACLHSWSY